MEIFQNMMILILVFCVVSSVLEIKNLKHHVNFIKQTKWEDDEMKEIDTSNVSLKEDDSNG